MFAHARISDLLGLKAMKKFIVDLGLVLFVAFFVSPANAFCLFSCEPTEANAKQILVNILGSSFKTPATVTNFQKTNGVKANVMGFDIYEMEFRADISFPKGFLTNPGDNVQDKLSNISKGFSVRADLENFKERMSMNWTMKARDDKAQWWDPFEFSTAGRVKFRKTEKGWEGMDGKVY